MRPSDLERERSCFEFLNKVAHEEVVVIGGYAVSAHALPRFSVDLDLVVASSAAQLLRKLLAIEGFSKERSWNGGGVFAGRSERWIRLINGKFPVYVDLLIGGISDRGTGVSYSYNELRERSSWKRIRGLSPGLEAEGLVPDRETLIALKLLVGRKVDLRDVVVLARHALNQETVVRLLRRAPKEKVREHTENLVSSISTKEFMNSLQGVFMLTNLDYEKFIDGARQLCIRLANEFR